MRKRILSIILKIVFWFFIVSVGSVILFRFIPVPLTPLMLIRCGEQLFSGEKIRLKKDWTRIEKISAAMPLAVIAAEDQRFEEHFGFDLEAIRKAEKYNERHLGKRTRGASTITQQTAKNLFLWPARSWIRKGFEVYFTFLIEIFWNKKRIMEVYLNIIETGKGIYGVEAASQFYFRKSSARLNIREAARIAAILPNPRVWNPLKPTARLSRKTERIIYFMGRMQTEKF